VDNTGKTSPPWFDKGLGLRLGVVMFHNHGVVQAVIGISP